MAKKKTIKKKPLKRVAPVKEAPKPAPKPAPRPMNTGAYLEIRKQLVQTKDDLLARIEQKAKKERYSLKREVGDIYDQAYTERERELTLLLSDIENQKLNEINEALQRIEKGEYGVCENCSGEIPLARLKIMPFARLCVGCQSGLEREMGEMKRRQAVETTGAGGRGRLEEEEA